jgi:CRISPR/Cas system endoribonuclease Cas6 (RAMP superfamily)
MVYFKYLELRKQTNRADGYKNDQQISEYILFISQIKENMMAKYVACMERSEMHTEF